MRTQGLGGDIVLHLQQEQRGRRACQRGLWRGQGRPGAPGPAACRRAGRGRDPGQRHQPGRRGPRLRHLRRRLGLPGAAVYGVAEGYPGAYYAQRTLLKKEVLPEHVAAAVFALTAGDLPLTTGLHVPVDSGSPPGSCGDGLRDGPGRGHRSGRLQRTDRHGGRNGPGFQSPGGAPFPEPAESGRRRAALGRPRAVRRDLRRAAGRGRGRPPRRGVRRRVGRGLRAAGRRRRSGRRPGQLPGPAERAAVRRGHRGRGRRRAVSTRGACTRPPGSPRSRSTRCSS